MTTSDGRPFCATAAPIICDTDINGYAVACQNRKCGAMSGIFPTKPMAIGRWNTRSATLLSPVSSAQLSELDAASNACLELCSRHGFATGHGDTVADLIREIDAQIAERLPSPVDNPSREELLAVVDKIRGGTLAGWGYGRNECADFIARLAANPLGPDSMNDKRAQLVAIARSRIGAMRIAPCSGIASSRQAAKEFENALDALSPPSPGERK